MTQSLPEGVARAGTPDIGFGVYVHWPFCAAKCPYCDFNSHVRHSPPDQKRFAAALAREIRHFGAATPGRTVTSIFFGGGTPSLMEPGTIETVLEAIANEWPVAPDAEITMEANPSSVEAGRFAGYRSAGVNRLSLGVQALNDADLKFLGRLHDTQSAIRAIELARSIFPRLSFDLIYARPGQTPEAWARELEEAIKLAADHLSLYQLTIEPETPFAALHARGKLPIPDPDMAATLFATTREITEQHGLPAYEISNHAVPGAESRHNLIYWRYGEYAGVGPGAHSRLVLPDHRLAQVTEKVPESWLDLVESRGHGVTFEETIAGEMAGDEMLLMGLRLVEGIDPRRYAALAGRRLDPVRLADLKAHGMVEEIAGGRIRASREGWFVLDAVVADLAA
ncbi:Oxygen-independent coproporphyrinogen-III oxidase 1 [Hartmannibacter diazotrophicus]|uniref:Heme chaperone HemW n=1 Tax=Hartmannibacter diazotrophicus TaxID=1482074 RepID=A0A2C9DDE8_9HYPH|nr:radical SAM family heme chaperone HemW [Hartmannibacter diazotrophicus]SON58344.1 Oxygen-independent coproporphyrinogen-III oxidase 1 [Hartmannibacter diazotrophicus]